MTVEAPFRKVVLAGRTGGEIGEAHGALWPAEIRDLAALRRRLTLEKSDLETERQLDLLARAHLRVLAAFDPDLHAETLAIARTSGATPEDVVVLNQYTDLRDIRRAVWGPLTGDGGGCSATLLPVDGGAAVSGQTWDMHGSARPFVRLVEVRREGFPAATLLTLTGCLALSGLNEEGVGVLINNLHSIDARVGVLWGAVVRKMLRERTAEAALDVLLAAPLGSGHHYLVSDGIDAFSVETSGTRKEVVARGTAAPLLHTNHCLSPAMEETESVPAASTTRLRLEHLAREVEALRRRTPRPTARGVARLFMSHEGYPRSLCMHVSTPEAPDAVDTCAVVAFDHGARRVLAVRGCAVTGAWLETDVGRDGERRAGPESPRWTPP